MRSRAQLGMLVWPLAFCFCLLEHSRAFNFPIPFFGPSYTNQQDVDAVNELYASLGWPDLNGWSASGGDPCNEAWQGVRCLGPNITAVELRGAGLEGKLSDALGKLTAITTLDLSSNNLSGKLPDSMTKLKSLSALHVQNNRLTGTLDVLGELPLRDLNVENNLFSGPIPVKLLSIPKFLRNGNRFSIPPIPGSSPTPATSSPSPAAHPHITVIPAVTPQDAAHGGGRPRHGKKVSPAKAAGFSVLAAGSLIITVLLTMFAVSRRRRERSLHVGFLRGVEMSTPSWVTEPPRPGAAAKPDKEHATVCPGEYAKAACSSTHSSLKKSSMTSTVSDNKVQGSSEGGRSLQLPFKFFTVASLQQCTNSFSGQNLMRETRFGNIYLAEHPESKFAVLKLRYTDAKMADDEFLQKVQNISGLRHPNVEELVGCCVEHGQRLLVYKHFSDRTLDDMIHDDGDSGSGDGPGNKFPWDARIAVALEAAKALEYLHDGGGQGQVVVHGHFRPEHVLVDSEMRGRVSGCGLAPFAPPPGTSGWCEFGDALISYDEPPEEAASLAAAMGGDVYSFGVVMLQLLTGRRPYDGARPRGERHLVPWAGERLHDLNELRRMADPHLLRLGGTQVPVRSLSRFADIVSRCVQREAEFRPAMAEVVQDLRRAMEEARVVAAVGA